MINDSDQLDKLLTTHLQQGHFTHAFVEGGFLYDDEPQYKKSLFDDRRNIFDLASLTKALVTTPLIFNEIASQKVKLEDTVRKWLLGTSHGLTNTLLLDLRVYELLRHSSGLPSWRNFWVNRITQKHELNKLEHIEAVLNRIHKLGDKSFVYSDVGFILLGYILERRSEKTLSQLFMSFLGENNLSFEDFSYVENIKQKDLIIPTAYCGLRKKLVTGEVHDENCAALSGVSGHAGLFGSGPSLIKYLKKLKDTDAGKMLWEENSARIKPKEDPLCGWRQGSGLSAHTFAGGESMGHLGFTGTAFWVDPKTEKYVVLLTNRVISGRMSPWMAQFRSQSLALLDNILNAAK